MIKAMMKDANDVVKFVCIGTQAEVDAWVADNINHWNLHYPGLLLVTEPYTPEPR